MKAALKMEKNEGLERVCVDDAGAQSFVPCMNKEGYGLAYSLSAKGDIRDIRYRTVCLKDDIHFAHCHGQNRMDEVLEINFSMNRQGRHSDSGNSQNPLAAIQACLNDVKLRKDGITLRLNLHIMQTSL